MNKYNTLKYLVVLFIFLGSHGWAQNLNFDWAQQFGSTNSSNDLQALASDNENNVFVFTDFDGEYTIDGNTVLTHGGKDLMLYSLNENGEVQWSVFEGGSKDEFAQKVACDDEGNVYIMGKFNSSMELNGETYESNGLFDMYMAKYSNEGDFIWCETFGGPNSESLISMEVKFNRIVLTGRFYNYTVIQEDTLWSYAGTDAFICKFDLDGQLRHSTTLGGESVDQISGLDVDAYANVYVTGEFYQDIHIDDVYFEADDYLGIYIAKYDASLNLIWAYQPLGIDLKPGVQLAVSSDGNCLVSGTFSGSITFDEHELNTAPYDEDIFMASFSVDGSIDWAQRFFSSSMENIVDIEVDQVGDIYLAGHYLNDINFNGLILNYSLC